jgi:hypothetical protein
MFGEAYEGACGSLVAWEPMRRERTEHLSDFCVQALLSTEDTETVADRRKIFAARKEPSN